MRGVGWGVDGGCELLSGFSGSPKAPRPATLLAVGTPAPATFWRFVEVSI